MVLRAAIAAVIAALALPSLASATLPGANGDLAFVSTRTGTPEIWSADALGGSQAQLTSTPNGAAQWPSWSPDRSRIAYVTSTSGSRWFLSVMNADGSGAHALLPSPDGYQAFDDGPSAWSPDGGWILFSSTRPFNAAWGLWEVRPDGSDLHAVSNGWGYAPAWSPDGTRIAYEGLDPAVGNVIVVANADGSDAHRLTSASRPETAPSWSPDGSRIAFGRYTADWRTSSAHAIFVVAADGAGETQVTSGGTYDDHPVWSPDGSRIALDRGGELFVVHPDGSGLTQLTTVGSNYTADWTTAADTTPPQIALTLPADGSSWLLGTLVNASYLCTDERGGSGIASCTTNQTGDALDTSAVGWHDFTVTARDNAGNTATQTSRYDVVWPFGGFTADSANADPGQAVSLRFSLDGPRGDAVSGVRWLAGDPADWSVSYNASRDRYTVTVGTQRAWDGSCRQVVVSLRDGSEHAATFCFTK